MRSIYFIRVLFISVEAFLIALAGYILISHRSHADALARSISINDDILKALNLIPLGLAIWIFTESKKLVFEKESHAKVLTEWPDYWKLKCHIFASLVYAVVFTTISLAPWLDKQGISIGSGLVLFLLGFGGQVVVAASIYGAGFQMNEILVKTVK